MTKTASAPDLIGSIDQMLSEVTGRRKAASTMSEPGSIGGETTHVTKNVDDGLKPATEGERSRENTADVKAAIGAPSVDSTTPGSGGTQEGQQLSVGVTSKPTGSDPTNETDSAKAGKDDPGSTHPARTDNSSLDGQKYASASFGELLKAASDIGNRLVASLANEPAPSTPATPAKTAAAAPAQSTPEQAAREAQAGFDAATAASEGFDKAAFDQMLLAEVAETVAIAERQAEKVAAAILAFRAKQAGMNGEEGAPPTEGGGEEGGSEEGGELSDEELMAALSGGGGGDPAAMGGGDPAAMGGGDPAAMGGDPMGGGDPAAMGGDPAGGAGGGEQEEMAMLMHVLQQAGITPEQLQALTAKQAADQLSKKASTVVKSTWAPKTAAQRKQADSALAYIKELVKTYG